MLAVLALGCGARTTLEVGAPADAGQPVAIDAGIDAGRDAGPDLEVACASDADCPSGVCRARRAFTPVDLEPLPLACGEVDEPGALVGEPCSARSDCGRGICTVSGACVMPCAVDPDCPSGERCVQVWVPTSGSAMQPLEACAPIVSAPPDVRVAGPEAGPRLLGGLEETSVTVLPGLAPSSLVVWTAGEGTIPMIREIRDADTRAVLYDPFTLGPDAPAPSWGVAALTVDEVTTLLYPNGPGTPMPAGGFEGGLSSFEPTATERIVLQRAGEGSVFDVDAYLVGGGGWSTSGGVPRQLQRAIDDANAILATVGLSIGEVRVHSVVGRLRRDFQVLEGEAPPLGAPPELPALYRLSAGARRPSIHVFFVRMIDGAAGIASGIPGPHAIHGTGASGVAIAVDVIPDELLGGVLVHEVGHFMGLFHTSEADGSTSEPLTDTPECRSDRDANGDGFLTPDECGDAASNVMFWAGLHAALSPQQGTIMRRAFFVR